MAKTERVKRSKSNSATEFPYERFKNVAASWSVDQFEKWLSDGAAALADRNDRLDRIRAFDFLLLDPEIKPGDQVGIALSELPDRAYIKSCRALENIVGHFPHRTSRIYIEFFFNLAGTLRPKGFARFVCDWLQRPLVAERLDDWQAVIRAAIIAASEFPYSEEFENLTSLVRQGSAWRPIFARYIILARVRSGSRGWPYVLEAYKRDLDKLHRDDPIEFQTFLLLLVQTAKPEGMAAELPMLVAGKLSHLSWIADCLVEKEKAPLSIQLDIHHILLTDGETSAILNFSSPILESAEQSVWKAFLNRKAPRPGPDHFAAKLKALEKTDAALAAA